MTSLSTASVVALLAPTIRADPDAIEIHFVAPDGCPGEARVRSEIEKILGRPLESEKVHLFARAEVIRERGAFRMAVVAETTEGIRERTIVDRSCAHLADAAAVVLALAIVDADEARSRHASEPADAGPPTPDRTPRTINAPARSDRRPSAAAVTGPAADATSLARPPAVQVAVGAAAAFDAALLPKPAPGVVGTLAVERGRIRLEGAFIYLAPQAALVDSGPAGGEVSLAAGAVRACYSPIRGSTADAAGCAGFEAGAMHGTGFGVDHPGEGTEPWLAPALGVRARVHVTDRVGLGASVDGLVALDRPRFLLERVGDVHRVPALTGRASAGVELRLW